MYTWVVQKVHLIMSELKLLWFSNELSKLSDQHWKFKDDLKTKHTKEDWDGKPRNKKIMFLKCFFINWNTVTVIYV